MTVAFCLDERGGLAFLGRRQSRDAALCRDVTALGARLWVTAYSAPLFQERAPLVTNGSFAEAKEGDVCFCEREVPESLLRRARRAVVYEWNRHYPADRFFDCSLSDFGFVLSETEEFCGTSHEKLTRKVYKK